MYGLSDAWQERRDPAPHPARTHPWCAGVEFQSAALHSLPPNYLPQRLSKSFFLMTKLSPNIFIYLCWQIFICEGVLYHLSLHAHGSSQSRGSTGVLD